jgi:hypothetical protein
MKAKSGGGELAGAMETGERKARHDAAAAQDCENLAPLTKNETGPTAARTLGAGRSVCRPAAAAGVKPRKTKIRTGAAQTLGVRREPAHGCEDAGGKRKHRAKINSGGVVE